MMMEVDETVRCRESRLVVGCHLDGEKKDIGVWCFASLPWEIYALMALKNRKVITNAQCKSCDFFDDMKTRMDEIQKTIGREKFNDCFEFNDQSSGKQFTRREVLGYFRREGDKTIKNIVLNHVKKTDGLYYRKYLMNHLGKNTKLFWEIPAFNRACWGCGICISVCPNEALVKLNDNTLAFVPWRCTRCKLCQKYCPERAMDNWQYKEVTLLGNDKIVVMDNLVPCPGCERAMKSMGGKYFCYYCGYEKAMEEATKRISEANVRNRIV